MLYPSCSMILLFPLLSSLHGPNKVVLDHFCAWIRCTKVSYWYSNGSCNSDLVEIFKTNAFNVSFGVFVLDRVIKPFATCNASLLVFLGWSTSPLLSWSLPLSRPISFSSSFYYPYLQRTTNRLITFSPPSPIPAGHLRRHPYDRLPFSYLSYLIIQPSSALLLL